MKKGVKIALIAVVSVLVVLGAGFAVVFATQGDYVKNKWAMLTKDEKEYFQWVAEKNIDKGIEEVKAKKAEIPEIDKFTVTSDLTVEIGDKLFSLAGQDDIKDIKPIKLYSQFAYDREDFGALLGAGYNNVDVFSTALRANLENKELYLSFPEYKKEAIDFSELMSLDLSGILDDDFAKALNEKFAEGGMNFQITKDDLKDPASFLLICKKAFLSGYEEGLGEAEERTVNDIDFRSVLMDYISEIEDVELEKDVDVKINGVEATCNSLAFEITKSDIVNITLDFLDANKDSISEFIEGAAETANQKIVIDEVFDTVKKALEEVKTNSEAKFDMDVVLYVNNKGEYIGANTKVSVDSYKVRIEFLNSDSKEDAEAGIKRTGIEISVNSTTLAKISVVCGKEDDYDTCEINIVPGSMITSLIGEDKKFELNITTKTREEGAVSDAELTMAVNMNDELLGKIKFSVNSNTEEANFPIDKTNAIKLSELGSRGYIKIGDLADYVFGKIDAINDSNIKGWVNSALSSYTGSISSFDDLKKNLTETDYSEYDAYINERLTKGISEILDALQNGTLFMMSGDGLGNFLTDAFTIKPAYDLDAVVSVSRGEMSDIVIPFDYGDLDVDTYYMEIPNPDDYINAFLAECTSQTVLSSDAGRTVQMNDRILFDAVPILAGFEVSAYEYTQVPTTIGKYEYGEGIDDLLIGMHAGESKKLELTLDDRFGDFAGYSGTFKITISGIYDEIEPAWTDAYIVSTLGYASLDDCLNKLCPDMSGKRIDKSSEEILSDLKQFIYENFVDKAKVKSYYAEYAEEISAGFDKQMENQSRGLYTTYKDYYLSLGNTESEFEELLYNDIIRNIALYGIDAYIAEKENMEFTYRDVFNELYPGYGDEEIISALENTDPDIMSLIVDNAYDEAVWTKLYNVVATK